MGFKKGQVANPKGRPKGAKNKVNEQIREQISTFISKKFPLIVEDFEQMKPSYRYKLIVELLPYVTPRLQSSKTDITFEDMSDEQLDTILDKLKLAAGITQENN